MKLTKLTVCALALAGLVACSNSDTASDAAQKGYLSFAVSAADVVENVTRAQITLGEAAGDYTAPADGDFTIEIIDENDEQAWSGKLSEWTATTPLTAGSYKVKATYDNGRVGFNSPVFSGSANVAILGGETANVEVPVTLQNAIVRLKYTDMFKNYYSFEKFTITSLNTAVDFTANETRGSFIETTTFKIEGTLTSQAQDKNGGNTTKTFSKEYVAAAAKCYTITFDASNIGGVNGIQIQFGDEPAETIDLGDIELNE